MVKLDAKFALELNHTPGVGPFLAALRSFATGGIQSIVAGAFGEFNQETKTIVKYCAIKAASTQTGLGLSPFANYKDSNPANIVKKMFARAVGCAAVRCNAELKLWRLYFVRPTTSAARHAARSAARNPNPYNDDSPHWFKDASSRFQYQEYYNYRNQYKG